MDVNLLVLHCSTQAYFNAYNRHDPGRCTIRSQTFRREPLLSSGQRVHAEGSWWTPASLGMRDTMSSLSILDGDNLQFISRRWRCLWHRSIGGF